MPRFACRRVANRRTADLWLGISDWGTPITVYSLPFTSTASKWVLPGHRLGITNRKEARAAANGSVIFILDFQNTSFVLVWCVVVGWLVFGRKQPAANHTSCPRFKILIYGIGAQSVRSSIAHIISHWSMCVSVCYLQKQKPRCIGGVLVCVCKCKVMGKFMGTFAHVVFGGWVCVPFEKKWDLLAQTPLDLNLPTPKQTIRNRTIIYQTYIQRDSLPRRSSAHKITFHILAAIFGGTLVVDAIWINWVLM